MTDGKIRLEQMLKRIYARPFLCRFLIILGRICQYSVAFYFFVQLVLDMILMHHYRALTVSVTAAFGFVFVTVLRKLVSTVRPYEVLEFCNTPPREKRGESFPSRHAYSAAVITVLSAALTPWCLVLTVPMFVGVCLSRILLGIHFPRDVVFGSLFGLLFGSVGLLISYFI